MACHLILFYFLCLHCKSFFSYRNNGSRHFGPLKVLDWVWAEIEFSGSKMPGFLPQKCQSCWSCCSVRPSLPHAAPIGRRRPKKHCLVSLSRLYSHSQGQRETEAEASYLLFLMDIPLLSLLSLMSGLNAWMWSSWLLFLCTFAAKQGTSSIIERLSAWERQERQCLFSSSSLGSSIPVYQTRLVPKIVFCQCAFPFARKNIVFRSFFQLGRGSKVRWSSSR